jgi:death on curing protein
MIDYIWIEEAVILAIHQEQLIEHGGLSGVRDQNLLRLAMARPQNLLNYDAPDIADLAASYGYGIARNRPFNEGNKRTAFVAVELFLALNGFELMADDAACVIQMLNLAAGNITEAEFALWIRLNGRAL